MDKPSYQGILIEYWKIIEINDSLLILEDALAEDNGQNQKLVIKRVMINTYNLLIVIMRF